MNKTLISKHPRTWLCAFYSLLGIGAAADYCTRRSQRSGGSRYPLGGLEPHKRTVPGRTGNLSRNPAENGPSAENKNQNLEPPTNFLIVRPIREGIKKPPHRGGFCWSCYCSMIWSKLMILAASARVMLRLGSNSRGVTPCTRL